MKYLETLRRRRSIYNLDKNLPISEEEVKELIEEVTLLTPDAFNVQNQRLVVATGQEQDELWDLIYDSFDGMVPREKIDSFKAAAGTILYYIHMPTIKKLEEDFPLYADNFYLWGHQSSAILQINLWNALISKGIGANVQHYNPVIDENIRKKWDIPEDWELVAQMPFGGIVEEPEALEKMPIEERVRFL